ncbi:peptide deformylase [Candidatus Peregrinibacteria bacterium]|nr:MAG: peptide deformylase [Candidatus Peregrinibacteria bacterium]
MPIPVEQGKENTILRTVSKPVKNFTPELRKFAEEMTKTMHFEKGVGIAAPQCGKNIRMAIVMLNPGQKNEIVFPIVNPEILELSEEMEDGEEGCLSLRGFWGKVKRHSFLTVRFQNLKGQEQTLTLEHFNARIIQHEVDHLDGKLFIDRAHEIEEKKKKKSK